jgi:hypothetical protein
MYRFYRCWRQGWRLDPNRLPCKVAHEVTHSSISPSALEWISSFASLSDLQLPRLACIHWSMLTYASDLQRPRLTLRPQTSWVQQLPPVALGPAAEASLSDLKHWNQARGVRTCCYCFRSTPCFVSPTPRTHATTPHAHRHAGKCVFKTALSI